jgi:hypothetical protein
VKPQLLASLGFTPPERKSNFRQEPIRDLRSPVERHCERSSPSNLLPASRDCFVANSAPRNDRPSNRTSLRAFYYRRHCERSSRSNLLSISRENLVPHCAPHNDKISRSNWYLQRLVQIFPFRIHRFYKIYFLFP